MHTAPTLKEIESFLNVTKTYNVKESYTALTDHSEHYRNIKVRIQDLAKKVNSQGEDKDKFHQIYFSLDEMKKKVLDFFQTLGDTYYADIKRVLTDPMSDIKITMLKEGKSNATTKVDENTKITSHINITPDASGLMTLAQELSNIHVLSHTTKQEREKDVKENNLIEKTTNMFISTMIIDYIAKDSNLPPQEVDRLQFNGLKELYGETNRLEADEEIFEIILDSYPEAFETNLDNFTPENFLSALEVAQEKMSTGDMEKINYRIKEIAEKGNTSRYIQGEVAAELTGLALNNEFHTHPESKDKTTEDLLESIQGTHIMTEVGGKTEEQLIEQGADLVNDELELTKEQENEAVMVLEMTKQQYDPDNPNRPVNNNTNNNYNH